MKRLMLWIAIACCLLMGSPAYAGDLVTGSKVFTAYCATCHAGGNNLVISTKNLRKETLERYDMFSSEAIQNQVIHGKRAMPAFGSRLSAEQIEHVASYVLQQAEEGW